MNPFFLSLNWVIFSSVTSGLTSFLRLWAAVCCRGRFSLNHKWSREVQHLRSFLNSYQCMLGLHLPLGTQRLCPPGGDEDGLLHLQAESGFTFTSSSNQIRF